MKKKIAICAVTMAMACTLGLAGCSGGADNNTNANNANNANVTNTAAQTLTEIGTKTDKTVAVTITNGTGKVITGMQVSDPATGEFGANVFSASNKVVNGEKVIVNLENTAQATSASTSAGDVAIKAYPDVRVTFSDGTTADLHQLNLSDVTDATLKLDGTMAYLEYTSASSKTVVNTLESEKAAAEAAEAAAAAAAAEEEEAAAEEDASTSTSDTTTYYEETTTYYEDTSSSDEFDTSGADSGSASDDSCLSGVVLRDQS